MKPSVYVKSTGSLLQMRDFELVRSKIYFTASCNSFLCYYTETKFFVDNEENAPQMALARKRHSARQRHMRPAAELEIYTFTI
jgi:hypothetical protein